LQIPLYIINLDRSPDRYKLVSQAAKEAGIPFRRIAAIEGRKIDVKTCKLVDEKAFLRQHGKTILAGEVGCYLSHLEALDRIINGQDDYAIIVEDDVAFAEDFVETVNQIIGLSGWDIVKFVNHRNRLFHPCYALENGYKLGRCLHGPLGSSAGYIVTKTGAALLKEKLAPMTLPFDVALERGWSGFEFFVLNHDIISLVAGAPSTILSKIGSYSGGNLPLWKRIQTLFFRLGDYLRRVRYGLRRTKLSKNET